VRGSAAALAMLDDLGIELDDCHLFHSARADMLRRLGRPDEAAQTYARATDLATSDAERVFLAGRLAALGSVRGKDAD
jgi:predicted RNA polymerase sigma factor